MPNFRLSKEPYAVKSEGLKNYLYVKLENHIERERERENYLLILSTLFFDGEILNLKFKFSIFRLKN